MFVDSSIKTYRQRNFFAILTIMFSTCLCIVTILYFTGYREAAKRDASGRYQAALVDVEEEVINDLVNNNSIEDIGVTYHLEEKNIDDYKIGFVYIDEGMLRLCKYPDIIGNLPQKKDEIAIISGYLNHLNLKLNVGDKIELNISGNEKEYTISGIISEEGAGRQFDIIVSKELIVTYDPAPLYTVYIRLVNSEKVSSDLLKSELSSIADRYGIDAKYLVFSSLYFFLREQSVLQDLGIFSWICIIIVLSCSLVIYSLFYSSVISKTNEYGQLRIIGATKKQIKSIAFVEGCYLSCVGITLGIVFGSIIGYILMPNGWNVFNNIFAAFSISLILFLMVSFSIKKPMRIAVNVTPIEAIRHSSYNEKMKKTKTRKLRRRMSPFRIAVMNFARNKTKTILIIGSLSICGILLMSSSAYLNSIDYEDMARSEFAYGELQVRLGSGGLGSYDSKEYYELQQNNILNSELLEMLYGVEGVDEIKEYKGIRLNTELPNGYSESFLMDGYNRSDNVLFEENLSQGTADYDVLVKENGILINNMNEWKMLYGWEVEIGDKICVSTISGSRYMFTIMGMVNTSIRYGGYNLFFMPEDNLELLANDLDNINYQLVIRINDKNTEEIEKEVRNIISSYSDLSFKTMKDSISRIEKSLESEKTPIYIITVFIGFFGVINLINTLVTNAIVRKREISVLQILGLTNRQLFQMFFYEGLIYSMSTIVISVTVGTGCGLFLCKIFNTIGFFGTVRYHFPLMQIGFYFTALAIIQLGISIVFIKVYGQQSLVERIEGI